MNLTGYDHTVFIAKAVFTTIFGVMRFVFSRAGSMGINDVYLHEDDDLQLHIQESTKFDLADIHVTTSQISKRNFGD